MNKRLQQRTDESDNLWWDAFATEFFEDDAQMTLTFCLEDGPKRYSEIQRDTKRYKEIQRDTKRYKEIQRDTVRRRKYDLRII
jgi:hypothetical protein